MNYSFKDIQCFIFTWPGYLQNAINLEKEFSKFIDVTVINSCKTKKDHWINLGEKAYFGEQFRKSLEEFRKTNKKIFFHTQADVSFDIFEKFLIESLDDIEKTNAGVWAPQVQNTYTLEGRKMKELRNNLFLEKTVDETTWMISKNIIDFFYEKKIEQCFKNNFYGWGYDLVMCSISWHIGMPVIKNYNYNLLHPKKKGYDIYLADKECQETISLLPQEIKQIAKIL